MQFISLRNRLHKVSAECDIVDVQLRVIKALLIELLNVNADIITALLSRIFCDMIR